ncbi:MAG: cellulose synthase family protein [Elusimicrobiota bacterium]
MAANNILLAIYFVSLFGLVVFGSHRYLLVYFYKKYKKLIPQTKPLVDPYPVVTVQLPIFNEMNVVARLIKNVVNLDYPKDMLEIQVLDDSTDETQQIAKETVDKFKKEGFNIFYIHRDNRTGFKAGALQNGMAKARGEFIAIFDADFVPKQDFLKNIMPYFSEDGIGMVQARWGHSNRKYSLLTKIQAIILDGHFLIEHTARNRSGRFFNFNGTAGIWRKKTIETSGGWQEDTLTEDMDLSYRAQINGWKFVFVPEVVTPAELPIDIDAFKIQQGRWAKGTIQVAKKLMGKILKSDTPLKIKLEALFHLSSNFSYLFLVAVSLVLLPAILVRLNTNNTNLFMIDIPIFVLGILLIAYFYYTSQKELGYSFWDSVKYIPFLMSTGIGLAINNSKCVLEGIYGYDSEFTRTPKCGMIGKTIELNAEKYKSKKNFIFYMELFMAIYFTILLYLAIKAGLYFLIPLILLFQFGFMYFSISSLLLSFKKFN